METNSTNLQFGQTNGIINPIKNKVCGFNTTDCNCGVLEVVLGENRTGNYYVRREWLSIQAKKHKAFHLCLHI
jgi:hypothetical protein